jgi:hypothetical protein
MSERQQNIERISVDWSNNVHVIEFAYLDPYYVKVKSYRLPNNALIIIQLSDEYVLIDTSDNGDIMERFETFEELNEYLRKEYGIELNEPETEG